MTVIGGKPFEKMRQFSLHLLPGTLLYTVLLKGSDACTGSLTWNRDVSVNL